MCTFVNMQTCKVFTKYIFLHCDHQTTYFYLHEVSDWFKHQSCHCFPGTSIHRQPSNSTTYIMYSRVVLKKFGKVNFWKFKDLQYVALVSYNRDPLQACHKKFYGAKSAKNYPNSNATYWRSLNFLKLTFPNFLRTTLVGILTYWQRWA